METRDDARLKILWGTGGSFIYFECRGENGMEHIAVIGETCPDIIMHNPKSVEVRGEKLWAEPRPSVRPQMFKDRQRVQKLYFFAAPASSPGGAAGRDPRLAQHDRGQGAGPALAGVLMRAAGGALPRPVLAVPWTICKKRTKKWKQRVFVASPCRVHRHDPSFSGTGFMVA